MQVGHYSQGAGKYGTAAGFTVEQVAKVRAQVAAGPNYRHRQMDLDWFAVQIAYMKEKPTVASRDVCDFCLGPEPVYVHETFLFSMPGHHDGYADYVDDGQWVACENCHWLVIRRDVDGLIARGPRDNDGPRRHALLRVTVEHLTGWYWRG